MDVPVRLLVVVALLVVFAVARAAHGRWRRGVLADDRPVPRLPAELVEGSERTWVLFTTPYCATCGPVADSLRQSDPGAAVVTVDATREPQLADAFLVRTAPTVLLADAEGQVQARLVGPAAVEGYVRDGYVRSPQ